MFPSRLYPILDVAAVENSGGGRAYGAVAQTLLEGCGIVQLRAKGATPQEILAFAAAIEAAREVESPQGLRPSSFSLANVEAQASTCLGAKADAGSSTSSAAADSGRNDNFVRGCTLILNDRPDLALLAGFDGCHLGQDDLSIAGARKILPKPKILGLSTHNEAQVRAGDATDADYLAIGPVFATVSKANPDPALGLAEFARLRRLTGKPVVAIGGITRDNGRAVLDAGADSVAMIGDLYRGCTMENFPGQFEQNVRDILARIL